MDYTSLSFGEIASGIRDVARDAQATFGGLSAAQLNWQSDPTRWSVAQCFEHLVTANRLMLESAERALQNGPTMWQRVPVLPGLIGPAMIRSQAPTVTRKYKAPPSARPTASEIGGDIIQRFTDQHAAIAAWMEKLDERAAARTIMGSPFLRLITYSVTDGLRLLVAHDHRHFEQARCVTQSEGFPL